MPPPNILMVSVMLMMGLPRAGRLDGKATGVLSRIFSSAMAEVDTDASAIDAAVTAIAILIIFIVDLMGRCFYDTFWLSWLIGHTNLPFEFLRLVRFVWFCQILMLSVTKSLNLVRLSWVRGVVWVDGVSTGKIS